MTPKHASFQHSTRPQCHLPQSLPVHLRYLVAETPQLPWVPSNIFLSKRHLSGTTSLSDSPYIYTLLSTGELLDVRFEGLFSAGGRKFGVLVARGVSLQEEVILGRSPDGSFSRFRVWKGLEQGFAGAEYEVSKEYRKAVVKREQSQMESQDAPGVNFRSEPTLQTQVGLQVRDEIPFALRKRNVEEGKGASLGEQFSPISFEVC
jgi:hypothetical protein